MKLTKMTFQIKQKKYINQRERIKLVKLKISEILKFEIVSDSNSIKYFIFSSTSNPYSFYLKILFI